MRIVHKKHGCKMLKALIDRSKTDTAHVEREVHRIIGNVRRDGDDAVVRYAQRWDELRPEAPVKVSTADMMEAWTHCSNDFRTAVKASADRIRRFAEWQRPHDWRRRPNLGISIGQMVRPLESVGCYVPGGRFSLPSSLLMTVIPAQVAGVRDIVVVSPRPTRETLGVAALLGVEHFYRVGGAHAIAALAYGTRTIPRVDKIVGPGNLYVTTAKKLVAFDCGIDFLAGPTEAVIVSSSGNPHFIAADLVAQAEHDPEALVIFITSSRPLAREVSIQARIQSARNAVAKQSLRRKGLIVVTRTDQQGMDIANSLAPEHLTVDAELLAHVRSAGSVFVGKWSPQAVGDYGVGPNHVLPTGGTARWRGGLSVLDFVKVITVQEVGPQGLHGIAKSMVTLALAEGLHAHARSIQMRWTNAKR